MIKKGNNTIVRLQIKALSANKAWQGRRFKTNAYKQFEYNLSYLLPLSLPSISKADIIANKPLKIAFKYGFSSKLSDVDNPIKLCLDIMQKKYGFDDRNVFEISAEKEIVKKGEEYIEIDANLYKAK